MKKTPLLLLLPWTLAVSVVGATDGAKSATGGAGLPSLGNAPFATEAGPLVDHYCANCHNDVDLKGGLDLTSLTYAPGDASNFLTWVKVHDRLAAGEMPPKNKERPAPAERDAFVAKLNAALTAQETETAAREGRATQRRLNRSEYENALRDLLDAPWLQVKEQLPEDGDAYHFNKVSSALDVSYVHMARYMGAADYALRQAISAQFTRPPTTIRRYFARESFTMRNPGDDGNPDRQKFPVLGMEADRNVLSGNAPMTVGAADPVARENEAMGWVQSNYSTGFGSTWGSFRAPVAGRYRLRFSGYTIWVGPGGTRTPTVSFIGQTPKGGDPTKMAVLPPEWYRPNFKEVGAGRRYEPIAVYAKGGGGNRRIGEFDITPEPSTRSIGEVWLVANDVVATDATRFFRSRPTGIPDGYTNPLAQRDGMPAVAFRWMEVEGPLYDEPTAPGYRLLFGDLPLKKVSDGAPGVGIEVVADAPPVTSGGRAPGGGAAARGNAGRAFGRGALGGGFGRVPPPVTVAVEVVSENPQQDAERLLRSFMARAYRRPVEEEDVQLFLGVIRQRMDAGLGFAGAMLAGYTAVLSSPKFVRVDEKPGRLDDDALAMRLSLFLWNSTPDATLRNLAARGELHRPEVLRAQTERLLDDPKSGRFVEAFLDYWLDLRKVNDTSPSTTLYSDYYIDDALVESALTETRMFFADLLQHDLPARNVVDSDYTFLNDRLAAHYGIPGVEGVTMRWMKLPPGSPRGGLMTQASVLKITANGTTTSPVLRGKWVRERIMGLDTPPPPPAVPAVEVDIRGAVTIRQQLDRHRADKTCAACHSKIDPPGLALENFDVMGAWRDRYRASAEDGEVETGFGKNGWPLNFHYALPVDASGELPDGRTFHGIREFKRLLLANETPISAEISRGNWWSTRRALRFAPPIAHPSKNCWRARARAVSGCAASCTPWCRVNFSRINDWAKSSAVAPNPMNRKFSAPVRHGPFIATRTPISRRRFLEGTGIALGLPFLDAMLPSFARAATSSSPLAPGAVPRRLFAVCNNLGLLAPGFFPTGVGRDYVASPYLEPLQEFRRDFTVFSGVSHPSVDSGHPADVCFLTAAPHPGSGSFHNTISLDQVIAEHIGIQTRFPSLTLAVNTRSRSLSCTGTGVAIPPEDKAADVFKQLFLQGTPAEVEAQVRRLDTGRSILDAVAQQTQNLQRTLGVNDRERLDQYFTSVRDLEHRLQVSKGWETKPKPVVQAPMPVDPANPAAYMAKVKLMYDLARLAFQTDSTRTITLMLDSAATPAVEGIPDVAITEGYHNLSHHGKSPEKLAQLQALDLAHMKLLAHLFADLKSAPEGGETLLDRTMVLYGSNLGDANAHVCTNMPVIFAGGGFRHGQHLAFNRENNYPLPNLFVSALQRLGIEESKFASSTGTMRGLDTV